MPPRYTYWTIIAGGLPTAFRAADRDELLPTFHRILGKHPDAQMKWFAKGKLWDSPEAARARHDDRGRRHGEPPDRNHGSRLGDRRSHTPAGPRQPGAEQRGRDWRPGGEHRDPRQKYVDAKKQRNAALRKERWGKKNAPHGERPHGKPTGGDIRLRPDRFQRKESGARGGPHQESKPDERRATTPPPRPNEPVVRPPGPPERGREKHRRPFQARGNHPKSPRRR